jgi:hypothetical protein
MNSNIDLTLSTIMKALLGSFVCLRRSRRFRRVFHWTCGKLIVMALFTRFHLREYRRVGDHHILLTFSADPFVPLLADIGKNTPEGPGRGIHGLVCATSNSTGSSSSNPSENRLWSPTLVVC